MPNVNSPFGLRPYSDTWGRPYNGAGRVYYVPAGNASAIYIGDPLVTITNSSDGNGVQAVQLATAGGGGLVLGPMMGRANSAGQTTIAVTRDQTPYLPASTAAYIYVCDDPSVLYCIQENGAMVSGASGRNADLVSGSGSTVTSLSGWQLNSSTLATTSTLQLRIVQLLQEADNAIGTNARWLTKLNTAQFSSATGV